MDELQVIGRGVILGKAAVRGPRQPPDRQVEPGRAELALVVAVRRELLHLEIAEPSQDVGRRPVNYCIAPTALLVLEPAGIAEAREDAAVLNPRYDRFVACKPGDRSDGSRDEQEPVGIPQVKPAETLRER